ncbi:DUF924 family protein [Oceanibacterium hippocampi]|uniref:DUF924 domain-containing protein n=1 Tax=Oceanibacterium hippocampi TaxID=745714 RepID=A0A1Y5REE9_9PROT|nr:DUF924 family protein [Oceanibacterium hippocampi]SLN15194.1 hypothetical protein OCH7691_00304 [Oceanibacterium hippocampi]
MQATPDTVLDFWFDPAHEPLWFVRDDTFDAAIEERFRSVFEAAARGDLDHWQATPRGALALVIVLDQFSRNLLRGDPATFAQDEKARAIADAALGGGDDERLETATERRFLYMPFMHSERLDDQARCVALFMARGEDQKSLESAIRHRDIIARFGRFPHRNAVLGRTSTPAEAEFLTEPGSSF